MNGFEFEVIGKVQGVFFRKFTQDKAIQLGILGWVRNHKSGTVQGVATHKDRKKLEEMQHFLTNEGSPNSKITNCKVRYFSDPKQVPLFSSFTVERSSSAPWVFD